MLQVSNLSKAYGSRVLFDKVTFTVGNGERVGLVGRNGSGKSTLFKLIMGFEQSDSGEVTFSKGYRIGYLDQHIKFTQNTLIEECGLALPEDQMYEYYRCEKILFGLGFTESDMEKDPRTFSGGYQLRINLAKCLVGEPDLLLLDEPTNYLDIVSMRWMRQFLHTFGGEAIIITHDRDFMDSVVTHTMGLKRYNLRKIEGDTEKYYEQLALEDEIYEKTRANQEKKLASMQRFVDRFKAKASKATQAKSVAKKIEKMSVMKQLDAEQMLGFRFNYKPIPAKRLITVENLSFGFQEDDLLFEDLTFDVKSDDRIAIIGKNGKGKTTLLNVIAGQLSPISGEVQIHPSVVMGYYQQTNRKALKPEFTVVQEIESANQMLDLTAVRAICGAMMFSGGDADKRIGVLSGGEQGRVLLGKVIAHSNNLLLLDEPTNHLDMESIEVMTEEIDQFEGPALIVTHDEQMLHRLATKLIVFRHGNAEVFEGTYAEFLEKWGWDNEDKPKKKKSAEKEERIEERQAAKDEVKRSKKVEKEIADTEAEIMKQEEKLQSLNKELSQSPQASDPNSELYKSIASLQDQISALYKRLEELSS